MDGHGSHIRHARRLITSAGRGYHGYVELHQEQDWHDKVAFTNSNTGMDGFGKWDKEYHYNQVGAKALVVGVGVDGEYPRRGQGYGNGDPPDG